MSEGRKEIFRQHRTSQDKYTYFLLAVAAAAIGFSVQRTTGLTRQWSMIPLGLAVLCWGVSFYCGCLHVRHVEMGLMANWANVNGSAVPGDTISGAIDSISKRASRSAKYQFRMLVWGAVLFIAWHVINMGYQTKNGGLSATETHQAYGVSGQ